MAKGIGRDHLDSGSMASPYRETEVMKDGSNAIADWSILNALLNTASGATWVSLHHGGGVGIGYSLHIGQVTVANGTPKAAERLKRVLTNDPGTGVMRHIYAGYEEAIDFAREKGLNLPMGLFISIWVLEYERNEKRFLLKVRGKPNSKAIVSYRYAA